MQLLRGENESGKKKYQPIKTLVRLQCAHQRAIGAIVMISLERTNSTDRDKNLSESGEAKYQTLVCEG